MNLELLNEIISGKIIKKTNKKISGYSIDTRSIKENNVYFALIGKNLDGHNFIKDAVLKHASVIIVSNLKEEYMNMDVSIIEVGDTTNSLVMLASYIRDNNNIPLIAITGSVGKTTTKELIYSILSKKYKVLKSKKNYNNRIGVALTLFNLDNSYDIILTEMGMNHLEEIRELSYMCKPDISIITNIGSSHIGYLNGKKNIFKAKMEILDGMNNGYLFVNGYDKYLKKVKSDKVNVIKVGNNRVVINDIKLFENFTIINITIDKEEYTIKYYLPGISMTINILFAIEIALYYKIDINSIIDSIESFKPSNKRLDRIELNNNITLIDDSYNASIESLMNDLSILKVIDKDKILIFGGFLELGKYNNKIHKQAIREIKKVPNLETYLVGTSASKYAYILKHKKVFKDSLELINYLKENNLNNKVILIKGSRLVGLDEVVNYLTSI